MSHDPRHEEWMVARLSGEELAEEIRSQLDDCPECRGLEGDLRMLTASLDRAGAHERAVVARLIERDDSEVAAPIGTNPPRRALPRFLVALAAGVLVGVVWWANRATDEPTRGSEGPGPLLGAEEIRDLAPSGEVSSFDAFTFAARRPPGGSFRVRVYDPDGGALLVESPPLEQTRWIPNVVERARIPAAFRWKVVLLDASDAEFDSRSAEVSLRPR